jgi:hypothetical protein
MTVDLYAFADELEKISGLGSAAKSAVEIAKKIKPGHLVYPGVAVGTLAAANLAGTAKRRYDIGKAYEEAQGV